MKTYLCKICGELVSHNSFLKHLVTSHKKKLMKEVKPIPVFCEKCGEPFTVVPEPIISVDGEVKWIVPAWCKNCSGKAYGFLVKYVDSSWISFRKKRKKRRENMRKLTMKELKETFIVDIEKDRQKRHENLRHLLEYLITYCRATRDGWIFINDDLRGKLSLKSGVIIILAARYAVGEMYDTDKSLYPSEIYYMLPEWLQPASHPQTAILDQINMISESYKIVRYPNEKYRFFDLKEAVAAISSVKLLQL